MTNHITNLKEKVFLMLYEKPSYKGKISERLYGKENKVVNRIFKELEDDNWIKEQKTDANHIDGRSWSQKNRISRPDPLLESIKQDLIDMENNSTIFKGDGTISLTKEEEHKLKLFLDHKIFRDFVGKLIRRYEEIYGLDHPMFSFHLIKNQLSGLCSFFFFNELLFASKNDPDFDKEKTDFLKRRYNLISKKKPKQISDLILHLRDRMMFKLFYLDYLNSLTLMSFLNLQSLHSGDIEETPEYAIGMDFFYNRFQETYLRSFNYFKIFKI